MRPGSFRTARCSAAGYPDREQADAAVKYAGERIQFGKEIGGHRLIQGLLAKSLGNITASIGMVTRVSEMLDEGTREMNTLIVGRAITGKAAFV